MESRRLTVVTWDQFPTITLKMKVSLSSSLGNSAQGTGPMRGGGAGGASAPGPGCLGGPGGKQKHRCWPSFFFDRKSVHGGSRILIRGGPT